MPSSPGACVPGAASAGVGFLPTSTLVFLESLPLLSGWHGRPVCRATIGPFIQNGLAPHVEGGLSGTLAARLSEGTSGPMSGDGGHQDGDSFACRTTWSL